MISVRGCWAGMAVLVLVAGCAQPAHAPVRPPDGAATAQIHPGNIKEVAADLPAGHEIGAVAGVSAPPAIWGLSGGWVANPAVCAVLADPLAGAGGSSRGLSGSGPSGISYAVVTASGAGPVVLDSDRVAGCGHWTMTQGRTTARVHLIEAPRIAGAATLGMASDISTVVEGGSEISSHADTFAAYLGDYYAFTALVADPGVQHPALDSRFAADLLVKTVAALRG